MQKIFVVGAETVAGANLALFLADHGEVTSAPLHGAATMPQSAAVTCRPEPASPEEFFADAAGAQAIFCGPAACSSWDTQFADGIDKSLVSTASHWARAASEAGCRLTYLSSDAVFTGPWLFHHEGGPGFCESRKATLLREAESAVMQAHPESLVLRTNLFGWSANGNGWIEERLAEISARRIVDQDWVRHATPMLATDFAGILLRAWNEKLQGLYHVAGSERVNPLKFCQRLADQADLPWLALRREELLLDVASEFASGECSLETKRLRKALCVAMPMISEGLNRLFEQRDNGFRDRLQGRTHEQRTRVA